MYQPIIQLSKSNQIKSNQIISNQIKFYLKSATCISKKNKIKNKLFNQLYSITNNQQIGHYITHLIYSWPHLCNDSALNMVQSSGFEGVVSLGRGFHVWGPRGWGTVCEVLGVGSSTEISVVLSQ